jgi:hypothetical protein
MADNEAPLRRCMTPQRAEDRVGKARTSDCRDAGVSAGARSASTAGSFADTTSAKTVMPGAMVLATFAETKSRPRAGGKRNRFDTLSFRFCAEPRHG